MAWTRFMDMHSGGGTKEEPYDKIYIELPQKEAEIYFYNKFGHNPNRITCTCCGNDYSIEEYSSLKKATAYDRGCHWDSKKNGYVDIPSRGGYSFNEYCSLDDYLNRKDVLFIHKKEIDISQTVGELPEQGYVWKV